jgi:hypothetical protein
MIIRGTGSEEVAQHRVHPRVDTFRVFKQLRGSKLVPAKWRCLVLGERRDAAKYAERA